MIATCEHCGKTFEYDNPKGGRPRKYCSIECRRIEKRRMLDERAPVRICEACGKPFKRVTSGKDSGRFCSRECAGNDTGRYCKTCGTRLPSKKKYLSVNCESCNENIRQELERKEAERLKRIAEHVCKTCGKHIHTSKMYCESCRSERMREQRRKFKDKTLRKHRGRARRFGCTIESVNKNEVYERDNWTCHICGERVPRDVEDNHPLHASIDHVIPLSLGGSHSMSNVRLAHRQCNRNYYEEQKRMYEIPTNVVGGGGLVK